MTDQVVPSRGYAMQRIDYKIRFYRHVLEKLDQIVVLCGYRSRSEAVRKILLAEWQRVQKRERIRQEKLKEPTP